MQLNTIWPQLPQTVIQSKCSPNLTVLKVLSSTTNQLRTAMHLMGWIVQVRHFHFLQFATLEALLSKKTNIVTRNNCQSIFKMLITGDRIVQLKNCFVHCFAFKIECTGSIHNVQFCCKGFADVEKKVDNFRSWIVFLYLSKKLS